MAQSQTLFASAARTTTQTSKDIINPGFHWIDVTMDTTVFGSGSVTVTINYLDAASGKYILLLSGAAVVSTVTNTYTVGPTAAASANVSIARNLPDVLQIVCTANNANTQTYSVGYVLS